MVDTLSSPLASPPARGLAARVTGVLTSPRAIYADVAARPRWFAMLIVVLAATIVPNVSFLSTGVGQRAAIDQQLQTLEAFGRTVSDAQYQQMERMAPYSAYFAAVSQVIVLPLSALAIAGIALAIFKGALGADARFTQVFAVVLCSSVITGLRALCSTPLSYARQSLSSQTNLAAVLPLFDENTFGSRLLGSIDVFLLWWIVNLAIGFGVLYKRRTAPIATTMLVVYGAITLTVAVARSVWAGA